VEVADLQAHAQYSGGYSESSPTVKLFWKVVAGLEAADRWARAALRWVLWPWCAVYVESSTACCVSAWAALWGRGLCWSAWVPSRSSSKGRAFCCRALPPLQGCAREVCYLQL
jgi:hypothetical protein